MTSADHCGNISLALTAAHIVHERCGDLMTVDRASMIHHYSACPRWRASQTIEEAAYAYVLRCIITPACGGKVRVRWTQRTNNGLNLEVYEG